MAVLHRFFCTSLDLVIISEKYVTELTQQALSKAIRGQTDQVLHMMLRKSVAEGVKRMYKHYRLMKWFQVQMIIHQLATSYDVDADMFLSSLDHYPVLNRPSHEDTTANSWVVMQCEFKRPC